MQRTLVIMVKEPRPGRVKTRLQGSHRLAKHGFDGLGQRSPISLAEFQRSTRQRILIGPAALTEHRLDARMGLLHADLGKPGVVARPLIALVRRRVAGVNEKDGPQRPIGRSHGQHRDAVIDGSFQGHAAAAEIGHLFFAVVPAVHGEAARTLAGPEGGRRHLGQ